MKSKLIKGSLIAGISLAAMSIIACGGNDSTILQPDTYSSSTGENSANAGNQSSSSINPAESSSSFYPTGSSSSFYPAGSSSSLYPTGSSSSFYPAGSSSSLYPTGSSSSLTPVESSSSTKPVVVAGTDILNGAGEFTKNGKIYTSTTDKLGDFKAYRWTASGTENGSIEYVRNDDGDVVLQFYPTVNNANIWDLQLEKDITIKAGHTYQIFIEGYDYGTSRNIHVGIQSLKGANGTSYENYISNDGSYWNTADYSWKSGKALVCQTKTAQFYVNAGGKKGEGVAIKSLKIIEEQMPAGVCDGNLTGTDVLGGIGEFTKNGKIYTSTTDKLGGFNVYRWTASGAENGTVEYIRNDDGDVVLQFYPTVNNANISDIQLEKDIQIREGYAYQVVLEGYDYGVTRNIHVGIQSLFDESTPGASYENYISDDGSFWNTGDYNWRSGKALVCQTKTAQFYVNAGGKKGEGLALKSIKVIEQKMPTGICK